MSPQNASIIYPKNYFSIVQFKQIIGQTNVKRYLIESTQHDHISHAQLFLGNEGCGALSLALAFAQYVNCTNRQTDDSCGRCSNCKKSQKLIHPDIHYCYPTIGSKAKSTDLLTEWREAVLKNPYMNVFQWLQHLKADNKQGNITAEECEDIIRKFSFTTYEAPYKILLLWMPEYLGKEGNRLLKIIEEPPSNTLFLLVAENADLVLNTILSRTQLLRIPRISETEIQEYLQEKFGLNPNFAQQIAILSEGNYNEVLNLMANNNHDNQQILVRWFTILLGKQTQIQNLPVWVEQLAEMGREAQKQFLRYSLHFLRQCLLKQHLPQHPLAMSSTEKELAQQLLQNNQRSQFELLYQFINGAFYHIERNANPRILFFNLSIKIADTLK